MTKYLEELVTKNVEIFTELPLDQQPQHDLLRGTFIDVDGSIATTRVKKPVAKKLPITARIHSSRELMDQFRLIKSSVEITLMQKSASIASRAIMEGIKATKPGFLEHQLHATIEYHSKMLGASGLAYVPVVAGGQNALILHYVTNNAVLKDGDLVLVDAGAVLEF